MKTLWVIRHGVAADRERWEGKDKDRPLTEDGRAKMEEMRRALGRLGLELDHLYTSPWLRARETAKVLAPLAREVIAIDSLARAPGPGLLADLHGDAVGVVGHEPWLSQLVAWLVTGDTRHAGRFEVKKGAAVCLGGKLAPASATLRALLPPGMLRRAARAKK